MDELTDSATAREGTARLAQEGEEWLPGRDFDLLDKIGGAGAGGGREGTESIVFRIRLRRAPAAEYALKQVVHYDARRETRDDTSLNAKFGTPLSPRPRCPQPHGCAA